MKTIVVVIRTTDERRQAEAMRAAVGLTLRGDRVRVVQAAPVAGEHPDVARCLGTLRALGQDVDAPMTAVHEAGAVEVWT